MFNWKELHLIFVFIIYFPIVQANPQKVNQQITNIVVYVKFGKTVCAAAIIAIVIQFGCIEFKHAWLLNVAGSKISFYVFQINNELLSNYQSVMILSGFNLRDPKSVIGSSGLMQNTRMELAVLGWIPRQ